MKPLAVIGIDPGPTESAYCVIGEDYRIFEVNKLDNKVFVGTIDLSDWARVKRLDTQLAIENIQSYGAIVGKSTFETCKMIGRIQQVADDEGVCWFEYPRQEYANWICGCKADDARVRQALLTRFGGDRKGEPLYQLKGDGSDKRSAFAVAVYHLDKLKLAEAGR